MGTLRSLPLRSRTLWLLAAASTILIYLLSSHRQKWASSAQAGFKLNRPTTSQPLTAYQERCRQQWFRTGTPCDSSHAWIQDKVEPIDLVWTWSNESDPQRISQRQKAFANAKPLRAISKMDLLKYSFRSAQQHLRQGFGNIVLLTPDYTDPHSPRTTDSLQESTGSTRVEFRDEQGNKRFGQKPWWLRLTDRFYEPVHLLHHWQAACPRSFSKRYSNLDADPLLSGRSSRSDRGEAFYNTHHCKTSPTPNFTPASIMDLASGARQLSDQRVLIESHHSLREDVSASDFWSPLYGPIFRLDSSGVTAKELPEADGTDMPAQQRANHLLGLRFGSRDRRALLNLPKVVSRSTVDEVHQIWDAQFQKFIANSIPSSFDVDVAFLQTHYTIERFREALLWSFFVAKHDKDGDGVYQPQEIDALLTDLGIDRRHKGPINVSRPMRTSGSIDHVNQNLALAGLPSILGWEPIRLGLDGSTEYTPSNTASQSPDKICQIEDVCLQPLLEGDPAEGLTPQFLFKRNAFGLWGCGDCILLHLVGKSGPKGLSAFLPSADLLLPAGDAKKVVEESQETLPLMETFEQLGAADFSIGAVGARTTRPNRSRLSFVTTLLSRYVYAVVEQSSAVSPTLVDEFRAMNTIMGLESSNFTFISLIDATSNSSDDASRTARAWFSTKFPLKMRFEENSRQL